MNDYFPRNSFLKFTLTTIGFFILMSIIAVIAYGVFKDSPYLVLIDIVTYLVLYLVLFIAPNTHEDRAAILRRPYEDTGSFMLTAAPFFIMSVTSVIYVNLISAISPELYEAFINSPNLASNMGDITDPLGFLASFIVIVILAPVIEELVFRGVLFNMLNRRLGVIASLIISGSFFGILHFATFFPAAIMGFVLGFIYHRTGDIRTSIKAHVFNNLVSFSMAYIPFLDFNDPGLIESGLGIVVIILDFVFIIWFARYFIRERRYLKARAPVYREVGYW